MKLIVDPYTCKNTGKQMLVGKPSKFIELSDLFLYKSILNIAFV